MTGRMLEGIKVLDVASFIAAPVAASMLGDFGAQVIKVEPTGGGDTYRNLANAPGYPRTDLNYAWIVDNRGKQGIALDLKSEAGREVLYRLVRESDVFVTNMPLGVRERLKIAWDDIRPLNPRIVYASLSAYGETGEEAGRTGFDSTALWARSGLMDLCKPSPDSAPARSLPGMGDHPTGVALFGAIMAGLYRRERTGKGGQVSTSLMANGLWMNAIAVQAMLCGAEFKHRPARERSQNALANHYQCRDGRWFILSMLNEDRQWPGFVAAIDRRDLLDDPRFRTTADRHANSEALTAELDGTFATRDCADWQPVLESAGLTFGQVARITDIPGDRQMLATESLVPFADPRAPGLLTVDSPIRLDGETKVPPTLAPDVGEHTDAILRSAGYSDAEIAALKASGAAA